MACSDNVVRAGLTPKFKDVDTLCEMLDYGCRTKEANIFPCHQDPSDPYVTIYDPPVADFAVRRIQVSLKTNLFAVDLHVESVTCTSHLLHNMLALLSEAGKRTTHFP